LIPSARIAERKAGLLSGGPAVALMPEAVCKSGPAVDVEQDIRDLAGRQQRVDRLLQLLSFGWRARLHGRDDQLSTCEVDTIELAPIGEPRHLLDFAVERRPAAGKIAFHVGVDRDRQWPLGLEQREGRLRNQVALEVLILAAAFDPDIAGAQPTMLGSARIRSEQSCNARVRRTHESKCSRPKDSDGSSDTHSGRVSAARGARDEHSTLARHGFLVSK
jgi:hypothetical protein